ncbi:unnamed protein product [Amoebophrya sp. A120]|nr:unnamed protein product [Amoebophrya sp. A120]|eukprot:GSA120T00003509001.1
MPTASSGGRELLPWEESLRNIPPENAEASLTIIEKLIKNVVADPTQEKFKRIKLSNPKIHLNITSVDPALEALLLMGWELLDEDTLFLPDDLMLNVSDYPGRIMEAKAFFAKNKAGGAMNRSAAASTAAAIGAISTAGSGTFAPQENGQSAGPTNSPSSKDTVVPAGGNKASVAPKSAFQFQNKRAKEEMENQAALSLQELRKQKAAQFANRSPSSQQSSQGFSDYFNFGGASSASSNPTPKPIPVQERSSKYKGSSVELKEMSEPLMNGQPTDNHIRPSHNFQKEAERQATRVADDKNDLRALQQAKYKQYQKDPNLQRKAAEDQARLQSGVAGTTCSNDDDGGSWWNPFSGGGGGSSGGAPPPAPGGGRGGARIKTVGDLPKPVRRG